MTDEVRLWRYVVPPAADHADCGGVFVLSSDGYFSCVTDWGNYAFQWRAFGPRDFRDFLTGLRTDYLLSKLAPARKYDGDATCQKVKRSIKEMVQKKEIAKERAQTELRLLDRHSKLDELYNYYKWLEYTLLAEPHQYYCESYDSQAISFCQRLYPRFIALLQVELAEVTP